MARSHTYTAITLLMAILCGCSSLEDSVGLRSDEAVQIAETSSAPDFVAVMDQIPVTRTVLSDGSEPGKYKVVWDSSDEICIAFTTENSGYYLGTYAAAPDRNDRTKAILTSEEDPMVCNIAGNPDNIFAIYPASSSVLATTYVLSSIMGYGNMDNFGNHLMDCSCVVKLQDTLTYQDEDIPFAPMVAKAGDGSSTLAFKNLCALLAVTVPYSEVKSVKSVTVRADKTIAGLARVNFDSDGIPSIEWETEGNSSAEGCPLSNSVTLECDEEGYAVMIPSNRSMTFYIPVPPATYSSLQIEVTDVNDIVYAMKTKPKTEFSIERSKIYSMDFIGVFGWAPKTEDGTTINMKWVRMWEDGPRFAACNYGGASSSTREDYGTRGTCLSWAAAVDWNGWGDNWSASASKEDWGRLAAMNAQSIFSYSIEGQWYMELKGASGSAYQYNSLYFPLGDMEVSGLHQQSWGANYFSSTPVDGNEDKGWSYRMDFSITSYDDGWGDVYDYTDEYCYCFAEEAAYAFIRPVLK